MHNRLPDMASIVPFIVCIICTIYTPLTSPATSLLYSNKLTQFEISFLLTTTSDSSKRIKAKNLFISLWIMMFWYTSAYAIAARLVRL